MSAAPGQLSYDSGAGGQSSGRSPLAHLLHALNQPLTGLQCSLELALVGVRTPEQYMRTLREAIDLMARMRVLVEAVRELADIEREPMDGQEVIALKTLLEETVDDLRPVAEERQISVQFQGDVPLAVRGERRKLTTVIFRFLESALSLSGLRSVFRVTSKAEGATACIAVSWSNAIAPQHSPFSRSELGLLIACAGWKQAGAEWSSERGAGTQTILVRLPLASSPASLQQLGDTK